MHSTAESHAHRGGHRRAAARITVATAALALALSGLAGTARAAAAPTVATGGAKDISYSSATLTGTIDPNGSATSYYFQFGPTSAYGWQSPIAGTGAGTKAIGVALGISGLAAADDLPLPARGRQRHRADDRRRPHLPDDQGASVAGHPRRSEPGPLRRPRDDPGHAPGTGNAGRPVVLQGNQLPYTAGFQDIGNAELTNPWAASASPCWAPP